MLDATAPAHWECRQQIACYLSDPSGDFRTASSVDYRVLQRYAESLVAGWGHPVAGSRIPVLCNNSVQTLAALVACLQSDLVLVQADPVWFEHYSDLIPDTPNSNPDTPNLNPDTPNLNPDTPNLNPDTRNLNSDTRNLNSDTPNLNSDTPNLNSDTPNFQSVDLVAILNNRREELAAGRYGETLAWLATIAFAAPSLNVGGQSSSACNANASNANSASSDSAQPGSSCTDNRDNNQRDFLIGFTSGSSGIPKAFVRTRQSWIESFRCAAQAFGSCADKTTLIPGPVSHGLSFFAVAESLDAGGTVYLQQRFNASYCLELMQTMTIDRLVVVPTMLTKIISEANGDKALRGPRRIICAGDKLSPMLLNDVQTLWPDTIVSEYYGASELSFVSVRHDAKHLPMQPPTHSVGAAFEGVDITIVPMVETVIDTESTIPDSCDSATSDPVHGAVVTAEDAGQIFIASDMLARGYIDRDGQRIVPLHGVSRAGRFAATVGDVGRLDEQGFLHLVDRASNMIISGGLNLYPAIVERAIERLDSVESCRVLGVADAMWGQRVVAVIKLNTDRKILPANADAASADTVNADTASADVASAVAISDTQKNSPAPVEVLSDTQKIRLQTTPVEMPDTPTKSSATSDTRKFPSAVTAPPYKLLKEKLHNHALVQLEPHQRPKRYFLIDDWPLTRSLKIDRVTLQQWLQTGHRAITAL